MSCIRPYVSVANPSVCVSLFVSLTNGKIAIHIQSGIKVVLSGYLFIQVVLGMY